MSKKKKVKSEKKKRSKLPSQGGEKKKPTRGIAPSRGGSTIRRIPLKLGTGSDTKGGRGEIQKGGSNIRGTPIN